MLLAHHVAERRDLTQWQTRKIGAIVVIVSFGDEDAVSIGYAVAGWEANNPIRQVKGISCETESLVGVGRAGSALAIIAFDNGVAEIIHIIFHVKLYRRANRDEGTSKGC